MNAGRSNADENIAGCQLGAVDHLIAVNQTNREACHVILIYRIEARHLSGLAADQCAACLTAAVCDTLYQLSDALRIVLADCNVVEEEQRLCAAACDVVDTHSDTVNTNRVMLVHQERQLQLGADAIGAGDQNRVLHSLYRRFKHAAEAADRTEYARNISAFDKRLHLFDSFITCGNIYTCCLVTFRTTINHFHQSHFQKYSFQRCPELRSDILR